VLVLGDVATVVVVDVVAGEPGGVTVSRKLPLAPPQEPAYPSTTIE
jgi:hypothetical protein